MPRDGEVLIRVPTLGPAAKIAVVQRATEPLSPCTADRSIVSPVDHVLPLPQFRAAFAAMETNQHIGKIVLDLS